MKKKRLQWQNCSEETFSRHLEDWLQDPSVRESLDRTLVFLDGDMGAGKSTWVRHLFKLLNPSAEFSGSPTFPILHSYHSDQRFGTLPLFHFDWYRIDSGEELKTRGLDELLDVIPALICVEWGDRCPELRRYWLSKSAQKRKSVWVVKIDFSETPDLRNVTLSRAIDFELE